MSQKARAEHHVKLFYFGEMTANDTTPQLSQGGATLIPTSNSSQNPTTKFADDTIGYEAQETRRVDLDPFSSHVIAPSSQTIVDYLQRPSIISSGNLSASDSGILFFADVTSLITPQKFSRMSNIYTYRADFEVTLQVNADRFQQGRYILFYLPTGGALSPANTGNSLLWKNMHTCNLTKITQLPHVEIDLATQTHVTLKIPYTSIYPMISWSTVNSASAQGLGIFGICPYSPLNPGSGGSTTCGYALLGSLQNVKIGSASVNQADDSTKEAQAQNIGPITSALNRVSLVGDVLGDVPLIGSAARNVSWYAKVASRATSIMGWSKPIALSAPTRMDRKTTPFNAVSDVSTNAKPLGVLSENSVRVPSSLTSSVDEMDYGFIVKHFAHLLSLSWTTSGVTGNVLGTIPVIPQGSVAWSKGYAHTPLSFVYNQFARYRGSIKYRFKLVKTAFHRGRLIVAFYPGISIGTPSIGNSEYVFREIVDVSTTSAFEVCCPYMVPTPWTNQNTQIGTMVVYILDPLVAPVSVSTSVDILLEVAGGDDMQFSVPITWQVEPYAPSTAQAGDESYSETPCFTLGPKSNAPLDLINVETSGEVVKSVRQLIKRNWHYGIGSGNLGGATYIQFYPYAVTPVTQAATTSGVLYRDTFKSDLVNLWSCAYAISYGSMLYTFRPPDGSLSGGPTQSYTLESAALFGTATQTAWYTSTSGYTPLGVLTYNTMNIEGPAEIRSPNWNGNLGRSTPAQFCNKSSLTSMIEPAANCTNIVLSDSQSIGNFNVGAARSAADDFGFGVFVGVPPVVAYSAT